MSTTNLCLINSSPPSDIAEETSQDMVANPDDSDSALISRLPNDLLYKVFLANSVIYLPVEKVFLHARFAWKHIADNSEHVRAAGQVCRRWREVTLAASALWGRVLDTHTMPPLWFQEVLRRSESAPLTVVSNFIRGPPDNPYSDANIRLLLQPDIINRLEVFHVDLDHPAIMYAVKGLSFPLLKRCSLAFSILSNWDRFGSAPGQLFGDRAPSLQQLQISGIIPRPSWSFYSTLTSLKIYQTPLNSILILQILQQTPMLEELSLGENVMANLVINGSNALNNQDILSIAVIPLPHLKRLHVYQEFCASFLEVLSRLRPKAVESLYIGSVVPFPGELWDTLIDSASKFLSPLPPSEARPGSGSVVVRYVGVSLHFGPQHVSLFRLTHDAIRPPGVEIQQLAMDLAVYLRHADDRALVDRDDFPKMLKRLCARFAPSFSCSRILTVYFRDGDYSFDDYDLQSMLAAFKSVSELRLSGTNFLESILQALSFTPLTSELDGSIDASKPLLPLLRVIKLQRAAITDNSTFAALTKLLAFRQEQNSGITELTLLPDSTPAAVEPQDPCTMANAAGHRCGHDIKLYVERVQSLIRDFKITVSPAA